MKLGYLGLAALAWGAISLDARGDDLTHGAKVRPLMQQALADISGREGLVLSVVFPPGHVDPPHRHPAHTFVYLLEGSVEMGMAGGKSVVLKPGDVFYEDPHGDHTVGRNLSKTKEAKLVVFLVKDIGKAPVLPPARN